MYKSVYLLFIVLSGWSINGHVGNLGKVNCVPTTTRDANKTTDGGSLYNAVRKEDLHLRVKDVIRQK